MNYIFDNDRPIYLQLLDQLRIEIVSGKLKSGDKLLSVRELALTRKVNPNTIQKALQELESEGLIYTERTNGKFVTDNQKLIDDAKTNLAKQMAKSYLDSMQSLCMDKKAAISYLQDLGGNV